MKNNEFKTVKPCKFYRRLKDSELEKESKKSNNYFLKKLYYSKKAQTQIIPEIKRILSVIFFTFIYGFGMAWFIQVSPVRLYTGGVPGIGQLVLDFFQYVLKVEISLNGQDISLSIFIFVANIPLMLLAFFKISKRFALYSLISAVIQATAVGYLRIQTFQTESPMVLSIVGGIIVGIGTGGALRYGGSTAGFDIVAHLLALKKAKLSFGVISTAINLSIMFLGCVFMLFHDGKDVIMYSKLFEGVPELKEYAVKGIKVHYSGAELAGATFIFTSIRLLISMVVTDKIHTSYNFQEVNIITNKEQEITEILLQKLGHGITLVDVRGGYGYNDRTMLVIIIYSFEKQEVIDIVKKMDPKAFVIFKSVREVGGNYRIKTVA